MKKVQTIIFSRNRPLQLDLCLKTLLNHCTDILQESEITVLYRNDEEYRKSFDNLMSEFPQISFKNEENFKKDLLNALSNESNISWGENEGFEAKYVLFLVDDSVICNNFNMSNVIKSLENSRNCLGFSLRLGLNTRYCYPYNCEQAIPPVVNLKNDVLMFDWKTAEYDFGYPLELSSSVYPVENIIDILQNCEFDSPNNLESIMSSCYFEDMSNLLMLPKSVAFSLPLNKVQSSHNNRSENFNPDTFRLMYEKGIRFDSKQFDGFISKGAHDLVENIKVVNINE